MNQQKDTSGVNKYNNNYYKVLIEGDKVEDYKEEGIKEIGNETDSTIKQVDRK